MTTIPYGRAINYSGYRKEHSPRYKKYPTKDQILEDLKLLEGNFDYLRLFDCSLHAYRTLEVIEEHNLPFQVMLGLSLAAEINHDNHPWHYVYKQKQLDQHKMDNETKIQEIIDLANRYSDIVCAISIGNEIRSPWSNRRLPIDRMVDVVTTIQSAVNAPVTYCEEYQIWVTELAPLAEVVDFISLHTYPAWQGSAIEDALDVAIKNYHEVAEAFPNKTCIITETGWPTSSHGAKIKVEHATVENQHTYNKQITDWADEHQTLVFLFEAFDEPWKGGNHPDEPEKHWGIYYENRTKK